MTKFVYLGFALLALTRFALWPTPNAFGVTPPPEGGYPGQNTAAGEDALFSLTTGIYNTAIGFQALYNTTTGSYNTATGENALHSNTSDYNTATGGHALYYNTTGESNTATGAFALVFNTTGNANTATGVDALDGNTTGSDNTATGAFALYQNDTGSRNTAAGVFALSGNGTADDNTASGYAALTGNTTGFANTAAGSNALFFNTTGNNNTAAGASALLNNTTGNSNTAIGLNALLNSNGSSNVALGYQAGVNLTAGNNNIHIGNVGVAGDSKRIRIGTTGTQTMTFIAGISGATVPNGAGVIVGPNGQLGTVLSSERFKEAIKPMDKASEAILALKPVTFCYKKELDPEGIPQFGLVAEEVEKVNPDLIAQDEQAKPYTVRYEAVNAMLLNEFLKAHRKVQELEANDAAQQKEIKALAATVKEQASQIQKVTAQLELSKFATGRIRRGGPAPQTVANSQ
jgi:Chaperone of endosialidase